MAAHLDGPSADIALWGLAWSGDDRAVPGLLDLLTRRKTGFTLYEQRTGKLSFWPNVPSLAELLTPCAPWAHSLTPAISPHLCPDRADDLRRSVLKTLARWAATQTAEVASVVPELIALLERDEWGWVAEVLGEIGPQAAQAAPELERLLGTGERRTLIEIAWAHFRVSGDPEPALRILGPRLGEDAHVSRRLGDLGPHAIAHVPALRLLAQALDRWTAHEAAHAGVGSTRSQPLIPVIVSMVFQPIDSSSNFQWQISAWTPSKFKTTGQSANQSPSSRKRTIANPVRRRPPSAARPAPCSSRTASSPTRKVGSKPEIPITIGDCPGSSRNGPADIYCRTVVPALP